jgi:uncharacterized protein
MKTRKPSTRVKTSPYYEEALRFSEAAQPDFASALRGLHRAYRQGDPRAAYALGTWYLHGKGDLIPKDLAKAVPLLREAAENDHAEAAYDLAVCYETGSGVRRSEKTAARQYLKAALLGDPQSIYHVARCYQHGIGVKRDRPIAALWYDRAEKLGFRR